MKTTCRYLIDGHKCVHQQSIVSECVLLNSSIIPGIITCKLEHGTPTVLSNTINGIFGPSTQAQNYYTWAR